MSEPALRLTGIAKTYNRGRPGAVQVLAGADLTLAEGEVVALVAPSGAGKSTLLHIAGLLDTADAGCVWLAGQDMTGASDRTRTAARRGLVGFVYQFHHLLPEFSAAENIVLPQLAHGVARAAADERAAMLLDRGAFGARGAPARRAFRGRAAACGLLPGARQRTAAVAGGRAHGQSRPRDVRPGVRRADVARARDGDGGAHRDP